MSRNQIQKWISDAAYYNSLKRESKLGQEDKDWLEAEQQYCELMKKPIKTGLVRIR